MSETIKVAVIGAGGRMGSEAAKAVEAAPDMELVGGDPSEADTFAEALTALATTGRLPQEEET